MLTLLWRHEFVNYVLWEVMFFVEPWLMKPITTISGRHETNQFPSFGCVLTKSPSMNDHCCPSRSTASWEEKVEVPNLGKISLVVDVVGLVLRIMRLWVCVNKNINIYELCVCIYPMPMYNWCSHLLVHIYYEGSIFHDGAMALHHHRTRNFTSF